MANEKHLQILKQGVEAWNKWRKENPDIKPDLRGADLNRAYLNRAYLVDAQIDGTKFTNADWGEGNGEHILKLLKAISKREEGIAEWNDWRKENPDIKPDLYGANLSRAGLREANLRGANLWLANLSDANLSEANLWLADLRQANLHGANLSQANLGVADLNFADLRDANLRDANLYGANLSQADLIQASLREANLSSADLSGTYLSRGDLSGANLSWADLSGANLSWADLSDANLSRADLSGLPTADVSFSGAVIDSEEGFPITRKRTKWFLITKINKDIQVGINGIRNPHNDTAALMTMTPPGDSMQGPNPEAVIRSLTHAQKLHGISFSLAAAFVLISILGSKDPFILFGVKIPPELFGLFAMPVSVGLLTLVSSFMADAVQGARYLNDRNSAMSVGNFPWALSKYAARGWINIILSFFTRLVMSYHTLAYPVVYIIYKENSQTFNVWFFWGFLILLFVFSTAIFVLSQKFQKPILFDRKTEEERQSDLEKLTEAVEKQTSNVAEQTQKLTKAVGNQTSKIAEQTEKITELLEILKPKKKQNTDPNQ